MTVFLTRKLQAFVTLSDEERAAVDRLEGEVVARRAGTDLMREGDRPRHVHVLIEGWAFRYKLLPDGGRQIMAYLLPGDMGDIHVRKQWRMDHNVGLLTDAQIGFIPEAAIIEVMDRFPRIARALSWATLVDGAILREWLVNSSRRKPAERLGHLICEMWLRMDAVGLVKSGNAFNLPLTQADLGDTIGLNAVTVNRVLQRLRALDLITFSNGWLTVNDATRLQIASGFDPDYLHCNAIRRGENPLRVD